MVDSLTALMQLWHTTQAAPWEKQVETMSSFLDQLNSRGVGDRELLILANHMALNLIHAHALALGQTDAWVLESLLRASSANVAGNAGS